jgi:hypothetical protein
LEEFHGLLSDERVRQHQQFADVNQSNFKQLLHFLKSYAKALSEKEPPQQQRFTLEFILPCAPPLLRWLGHHTLGEPSPDVAANSRCPCSPMPSDAVRQFVEAFTWCDGLRWHH